jgi:tetratricopeptide (TPR) repeat protein
MGALQLVLLAIGVIIFAALGAGWVLVRRQEKQLAASASKHHASHTRPSTPPRSIKTPPPDASAPPHKRGVAHLLRGEYPQAAEAFTEAIQLDPDAPNPYIGRAIAYRRLQKMSDAIHDEKKAQELGGAEETAWDRLVNRARLRWRWDFDNPDWPRVDPLSRNAVLLAMLSRQINNGGLRQWIANGYTRWIDDVIAAAREVGTESSAEVVAILEVVARHLDAGTISADVRDDDTPDLEGEDASLTEFYQCEDRYFKVQMQFVPDLETWLEEKCAALGR